MSMRIWSGQFHILRRQHQHLGPYAAVFRNPGPHRFSSHFFTLLEPLAPEMGAPIADLADAFGAFVRQNSGSLTGTLLRCIGEAEQRIRRWKTARQGEDRDGLAFAGLAVRGDQAYLAQAGPAVTYWKRGCEVRRIVADRSAAVPIGTSATAEPIFRFFPLKAGDQFLLTFQLLDRHLAPGMLSSTLGRRPDESLAALHGLVLPEEDFAALLIAVDPPSGTPDEVSFLPQYARQPSTDDPSLLGRQPVSRTFASSARNPRA